MKEWIYFLKKTVSGGVEMSHLLELGNALNERDYWIAQYHSKETSKIIQNLNEKLEIKDEKIERLKEHINELEKRLKVIPFVKSN